MIDWLQPSCAGRDERCVTRRVIYLVAFLAPAWAMAAVVTDGVAWMIGPLRLSSTEPIRPLVIGLAAAIYYLWRFPRSQRDQDGQWMERTIRRVSPLAAVTACAAAALAIGIWFGTFVAGGSDSYGYVSQAGLWLRGNLRIEQPIVQQMSWPNGEWAFAPLGYRPLSSDGTIVPTYAPGLPILMAGFLGLFGPSGPFLVVPIAGMLAMWFTYLLGRDVTGSKTVGACAALLLLASPVFLAHLMVPMTDVPVAAGWTLVCLLALNTANPRRAAFLAGLTAGLMLLVRPNLLLLVAAPAIAWRFKNLFGFVAGLAPGLAAIAAFNGSLYGSPFDSGYGDLTDIYALAAAPANLRHYAVWLAQTQSPLIVLALVPLFAKSALLSDTERPSPRVLLYGIIAATLISYVFYGPFDVWLYLRFLLPAYPALFVLMAAGLRFVCVRLAVPARAPGAVLLLVFCIPLSVLFARDQGIFNSRESERRHVRAAQEIARLTPPAGVILAVQHSGSVRFYADRITLRYDWLAEDHLDAALGDLVSRGYRPYIVIDDWEEAGFRNRFSRQNRVGRLDWPPLARVPGDIEVRIYDPEGRAE
jgi:hypothetical protein